MQCPACGALSGSWRRPCGRCGERPSLRAYGRLAFAEDPTTPNRVRHPRPAEIAPPRARITAAALDVTFAALALFWSGTIGPDPAFASGQSSARLLSRVLVVLAVLAAPAVMEAAGGQTFGKRIVGIRVVDRGTGRPIGFWTAVHRGGARALFWFVSFLALADPLLQPLHDRSAGTVVINDDDAGWVPPPDSVIRSP